MVISLEQNTNHTYEYGGKLKLKVCMNMQDGAQN